MHFCDQKLSCRCAQPYSNEFDKPAHITKRFCKQKLHKLLTDNYKTIFSFALYGERYMEFKKLLLIVE